MEGYTEKRAPEPTSPTRSALRAYAARKSSAAD